MIRWIPPSLINQRHLQAIASSLHVCPEDARHDPVEFAQGLNAGHYRLFEYEHGIFVVHRENNRLVIDAMEASIWNRNSLALVIKQLAADWLCDKVQTTVFDKRLADAIVSIGGVVESYDLVLDVGTDDEQQEKVHDEL